MPVSLAGAVYGTGVSAIWYQWKNMFATPFYWLMAPLFRRVRRTTTAELVEDRYGPWMGALYTLFALGFFTINMASMLKGAAKVISQAVGGHVPVNEIVVAMTVIFILYSFIGGLVATAWTDFLQGFLIIVLSFLLIPLGWGVAGGMDGMRQSLEPHKFSLATPAGIGPWFIFMLTLNGLIGIAAQPHLVASVGTGKDELACRAGFLYGNFVKRFCTIGWTMVGLLTAALVAQNRFGVSSLSEPEEAFGFACRHLLFTGGVGLLIASVLAANMAGCSAFMVDSGALFTRNFYQRFLTPGRADSHYLWVGRVSGLAITLAAVVYSLFFIDRVLYSFLLTETMATYVGIGLLGGVLWRRANRWGALAGAGSAMITNFAVYGAMGKRFDHWDPDVFLAALAAGVVAFVAVSLLTPPEPARQTGVFFRRLETPSRYDVPEDEPEEAVRRRARESAEAGEQLLLVNLFHPVRGAAGAGFWRAYRVDMKGFACGWLLALGMVALAWLVFRG
jgi:Na+/proline symporter